MAVKLQQKTGQHFYRELCRTVAKMSVTLEWEGPGVPAQSSDTQMKQQRTNRNK
jgi:hypothetical protein